MLEEERLWIPLGWWDRADPP